MSRRTTLLAAGAATLGPAATGPAASSIAPLRRRLSPRLSGISGLPHVALTFDDGPDQMSTPRFLDLLAAHGRTATFFLLGEYLSRHRGLVAEMAARGHELGMHGWDHRCVVLTRPSVLSDDIVRTADLVTDITGEPVRWYRPPYGVLTTAALLAARRAGLRTVLWSAWGRDWEARATPESVLRTLSHTLGAGGTVLLHDSDRTSAPGSWWTTLAATQTLLATCAGSELGPLRDHVPAQPAPGGSRRLR